MWPICHMYLISRKTKLCQRSHDGIVLALKTFDGPVPGHQKKKKKSFCVVSEPFIELLEKNANMRPCSEVPPKYRMAKI
jgi:hypothetical protein